MADKHLNSFSALLADLFREVSAVVFWSLLLGGLAGAGLGLWAYASAFSGGGVISGIRVFLCFIVLPAVGGAVVGCALGALFDYLLGRLRGENRSEPKNRGR